MPPVTAVCAAGWLALFAGTYGCGATLPPNAPMFVPAAEPQTGSALLYVFCIGGTQPTIKIAGVPYVTLPSGGYAYAYLPAGTTAVEIDFPWGSGPGDMAFDLVLAAGEAAYLRIESSVYPGLGEQGSVALVEPEFVLPQLRACCRLVKGADLSRKRPAAVVDVPPSGSR